MAVLQKNTWKVFFAVFFLSAAVFIYICSIEYNNYYNSFKQQNIHTIDVLSRSVHSFLVQNEIILDVIGGYAAHHGGLDEPSRLTEAFDEALKVNPTVQAFGIATVDGEQIAVSSNVDIKKVPNLKTFKESKDSFLEALESDKMVLGRTYFASGPNSWAIPIRKAVRDEKGHAVAMMIAGLTVKDNMIFSNEVLLDDSHRLTLLRNRDQRVQYQITQKGVAFEKFKKRLSAERYRFLTHHIENASGKNLDALKLDESIVSFEGPSRDTQEDSLYVAKYNNRYEIWLLSKVSLSSVYEKFSMFFVSAFVIYAISILLLAYVFRYVDQLNRKIHERLLEKASHDLLTGLPNRYYLNTHIERWSEDFSQDFGLLFIDMNNFKYINDNYGHDYGDKILLEITKRFQAFKTEGDLAVRQSGDEFIMLTKNHEKESLVDYAKKLVEKLTEAYIIDQYQFRLGASIGISVFPENGKSLNALLRAADIAMYEAKKRNEAYCFFDHDLEKKFKENSEIENELKFALERDEISMVYQPQMCADGKLHGVEALARWHSGQLGNVPPDQFIQVAEDTALIVEIGDFILERTLTDITKLQKRIDRQFSLSINISLKQFMEKEFIEKLKNAIKNSGFDKKLLTLEITESVFINDVNHVVTILTKLKQEGIRTSLDDFGTGYSSLSLLTILPIDELKVDKSFTGKILVDSASQSMVHSITQICKNLNFSIVAEGIEEKEQEEVLKNFDCEIFQGYFYSKPLQAEDLKHFINSCTIKYA